MLLLLAATAAAYLLRDALAERRGLRFEHGGRLAVLPIENGAGDADEWVRWGLAAMIGETLERTPGIEVLDAERLAQVLGARGLEPTSPAARRRTRELVGAMGSAILVDATHRRDQLGARLVVEIVAEGRTTRRVYDAPDAFSAADALVAELGAALVPGFDPLPIRRSFSHDPFYDRLYGTGLHHFLRRHFPAADSGPAGVTQLQTARRYLDLVAKDLPRFLAARTRRAECLVESGELDEARSEAEELLQAAQAENHDALLVRLFRLLGRLDAVEGHFSVAEVQLRESHRLALARNDSGARAAALEELARLALAAGESERAEERFLEVHEIRKGENDLLGRIDVLLRIGSLLLAEGAPRDALAVLDEASALAQSVEDAWSAHRAAASLGEAHARVGDLAAAEASWRRALRFYHQQEDPQRVQLLSRKLAELEMRQGDWKSAETLYKDQLDAARQSADERSEAQAAVRLAWLQLRLGFPFLAREYLDRALELDRHLDSRSDLQRVIAWFAYEEENWPLAVRTQEQMVERCRQQGCLLALDEAFLEVFRRAAVEERRLPLPGEPDH